MDSSIDERGLVFHIIQFSPLVIVERGFKTGAEMEMKIEILWTEEDKEVLGYRFRRV